MGSYRDMMRYDEICSSNRINFTLHHSCTTLAPIIPILPLILLIPHAVGGSPTEDQLLPVESSGARPSRSVSTLSALRCQRRRGHVPMSCSFLNRSWTTRNGRTSSIFGPHPRPNFQARNRRDLRRVESSSWCSSPPRHRFCPLLSLAHGLRPGDP